MDIDPQKVIQELARQVADLSVQVAMLRAAMDTPTDPKGTTNGND